MLEVLEIAICGARPASCTHARPEEEVAMEIVHVTLTADRESRLPLFPEERAYRLALRKLGAVAAGCLALFAVVAEHMHLVALLSRAAAGRLAQRLLLALRPIVATPLAASHIRLVETRAHMRWLLRYLLEQPKAHGMPAHPALWVGSCLPDLVGARVIEGLSLCVSRALPEYTDAVALRIAGLPGSRVPPADRAALASRGAAGLCRATAASLAAHPALATCPGARLGRRVFGQLASLAAVPPAEVARVLGRSPDTTWRLRKETVESTAVDAAARWVALERLVEQQRQLGATESRR
jgi:hypothetical protein